MRDNSADVVSNFGLPAGGVREKKLIAIYGSFNPITVEHFQLVKKAHKLGDVIILLKSEPGNWDRDAEMLMCIKGIGAVVEMGESLVEDLKKIKPDYHCAVGDTELLEWIEPA